MDLRALHFQRYRPAGPDTHRRLKLTTQFRTLWTAGTVGAYFTAVVALVPGSIASVSLHPDCVITGESALRYLYLIWLLGYFFISSEAAQSHSSPASTG